MIDTVFSEKLSNLKSFLTTKNILLLPPTLSQRGTTTSKQIRKMKTMKLVRQITYELRSAHAPKHWHQISIQGDF
jgi:hypothetical protein